MPEREGDTAEAQAARHSAATQQADVDAPAQEQLGAAHAEEAALLQQANGGGRRRTELEKLQLWAGDP